MSTDILSKYIMVNGNSLKHCCSISYDILTIIVSIADVTTDIIVLIDFYEKERMTFFTISLVVLIMAQCSYSIAFSVRFDTVDEIGFCLACCLFCCMLPFGSFVAFCIYIADEDCLDIGGNSMFTISVRDSDLTKWIKRKLNKHIGFILEALIEAFPQSLIQISAIVYYQEANAIAILSILISMASVMSKSLILSKGVEKYTFIWTWLCAVTDFFGIFFTLTWVFYSHDSLNNHLFGYFNIFGMIWLLKTAVSILLPVALALTVFFLVGYLSGLGFIIMQMIIDMQYPSYCEAFGYSLLWLTFAPVCAILFAFCASLAAEVLCFAIIALLVYSISTDRIEAYDTTQVGEVIEFVLSFIANTNNGKHDRMIRILSVNWAFWICTNYNTDLGPFIQERSDKGKHDALAQITYRKIRTRADNPLKANYPKYVRVNFMKTFRSIKTDAYAPRCCTWTSFVEWLWLIFAVLVFFIFMPIYFVSKLVQIAYPWIILVYLIWNDMLFTQQIDGFQLTMLEIYIFLQLVLLFLGVYVLRLHWWLWHISPGRDNVYFRRVQLSQLSHRVDKFYDDMVWFPKTNEIVLRCLGCDIGKMVMDYVKCMKLDIV
eukprot:829138_1